MKLQMKKLKKTPQKLIMSIFKDFVVGTPDSSFGKDKNEDETKELFQEITIDMAEIIHRRIAAKVIKKFLKELA